MARGCLNCGGEEEPSMRLRRGLCPQCADAYARACDDISAEIRGRRAHLATFGDEAGDAAVDALNATLADIRKLQTEEERDELQGEG